MFAPNVIEYTDEQMYRYHHLASHLIDHWAMLNCLKPLSQVFFMIINKCLRLSVITFVTKPLNFQPPQKLCNNLFGVTQDPILVQLILIIQKITKKSLLGHFLGYPPKMHYSALQCSAMD